MIVVLITIAILVSGIVFLWLHDVHYNDALETAGVFMTIFGSFALVIALIAVIAINVNPIGKKMAADAKRETLVYQLENETYKNDNNLGTTDLFSSVAEYNGKVLAGRRGRHNLWTGWFYAPYWDEVELINLEDYK